MKTQRMLIVLTVLNLVFLVFIVAQFRPAAAQGIAPVLRGRALEIVDDQGRTRASITLLPGGSMPNGDKYSETVILRLIDPRGKPGVKLTNSQEGSGLGLLGDKDETYALIEADARGPRVKLTKDGKDRIVEP